MSRYYSDSDDAYYPSRQQSDSIRASGWQSPLPSIDETSSSGVTRLVVESPFGLKRCEYTIDKSQRGRLIVTARRRNTFASDYLSLNNKNNTAVQTFAIPFEADVDRLQSHIEQQTNRLIIEIPRSRSSYPETRNTYVRSPNLFKSSTGATHHNRKLEYRIDCRGYTPDELDVFIHDRDLIVRSRMKRSTSSNPTHQHTSEQFSQKISLPNTVDLAKVISYFENGELRVEAPLKRGIHYNDEEILAPRHTSNAVVSRIVGGEHSRVQSPIQGNHRRHYRRREHVSRHQPSSNVMQRIRSAEGVRYPLYRSTRDFDDDDYDEDDNRYRRTASYHRYNSNRHHSEQPPLSRSIYEPPHNGVTTRTTATYRTYPLDNNMYSKY